MNKKRIILVDDKPVYRNAVKMLLNKIGDVEIVAEASNGIEFLNLIETCEADIVFMDIEMPEMNGIEATRKALEKKPDLVIIGLSMYEHEKYIDELLAAGAKGYLLKLSDNTSVFKTIFNFPNAEIFFSNEIEIKRSKEKTKKIF